MRAPSGDEFTESERIRKIIWIIFSAINNINSALHLTQTYSIPPERTAAATHRHLDYFVNQFVNIRTADHSRTRGAARGDCIIPFRKSAFGQTAFSVRAAAEWNLTPINIRNLNTYSTFKIQLKKWLIDNQSCQH